MKNFVWFLSLAAFVWACQPAMDKEQFMELVKKSQVEEVKTAVPELPNEDRQAILAEAMSLSIRTNRDKVADALLESLNDFSTTFTDYEVTLLMMAAEAGKTDMVKKMLKKGAQVSETDDYGTNALQYALSKDHTEAAKVLIEAGSELNTNSRQFYHPLYQVALTGNTELMHMMLDKGADIDHATREGLTAIFGAIEKKHEDAVALLMDEGADLEAEGRYADILYDPVEFATMMATEDSTIVNMLMEPVEATPEGDEAS